MTDLRLKIEDQESPLDAEADEQFQAQLKELALRVNPYNKADYLQLYQILNQHLSYPQSQLAHSHREANRLGWVDSKIAKQIDARKTLIRVKSKICNCCGFFVQEEELEMCTHGILDVSNMGSPTIVFFKTFPNLALLLALMLTLYSIFALATNLTTASQNKGTLDFLSISLSAKINSSGDIAQNSKTYYLISSWLGVPMLLLWVLCFAGMAKAIRKVENEEKLYTSIADFSVVVEKMPTGLSKQELQAMVDEYFLRVAPQDVDFRQMRVEKYNEAKPFYFNVEEFANEELEQLYERLGQIKEEVVEWIEERQEEDQFSSTQVYREARLKELQEVKAKIAVKNEEIIAKIKSNLKERKKSAKTFVFITFQTIEQRDFFLSHNDNSIWSKIKNTIPCCFDKKQRFFVTKDGHQFKNLIIEGAPQPQDINWGNIGFGECESVWRKFVTFTATLFILGVSFVIVYGLSSLQNQNSQRRFVSILISLVISAVNIIIIKVIQHMTLVEKNYTNNTLQISLAYKSILAQLINTVFIPIIVNIKIKNNLYNESGLAEDIFILAIANSFIPPLVRIIDPYYIFTYLKYSYYDRPYKKMTLSQYELNLIAQKPQYQIGLQYIYPISNFLFICFFVSLQPIIPAFGIMGLFCMYWIEKYALYYRSQRPIPGANTIGLVMYQMIYFGGIAYVLGSLTWSIFINSQRFQGSLVANLVAGGIAVVGFVLPYEAFLDYKDNINYKKSYEERRVYFAAEYDRLNPATKEEGVREYKQFLLRKRAEIDGMSDVLQQNISDQLAHLTQNNTYKQHILGNNIFGHNEVSIGLLQLMQNQSRNIVDPKVLTSYLGLRHPHDRHLAEYVSAIELREEKPFKQAQQSLKRSLKVSPHQDLPNPYPSLIYRPDKEFRNVYKSTLHLQDLGLASKILPNKHRPNE